MANTLNEQGDTTNAAIATAAPGGKKQLSLSLSLSQEIQLN